MAAAHTAAAASERGTSLSINVGGITSLQRSRVQLTQVKVPQTQIRSVQGVSVFFGTGVERSAPRLLNGCVGRHPMACVSPVNEVVVDSATKLDVSSVLTEEISTPPPRAPPALETSISAFMVDVANLVKLVDSRDIVELELKHKEYEIIIRKKEALPPPQQATFPGPHVMAHTPQFYPAPPPQQEAEAPPVQSTPAAPPAPPAAPQLPPMLSPMAGTFYRSPAPGESAFVQVGDKVSKGQVLCIVEAMKLMNEIEADRSGTIVEIVAEDGKPVSIESPLYVIKP